MSATHSRARGELSRRIRTRLAHAELSRVQLANAAELSVTTINNALNPMKDPPTADALNRLAAALDVTGTALTQWRVLRDRADASPRPDSPYLFHYLRAARRAACQRLYPGAVPGTIPPLPTIYVSRSAYPDSRAWTASPLHWRTGQRIAAEAILEQGQNCLILGEPGSGKSTLLRAGLAAIADHWLADREGAAVPVLVPAACLTGRTAALHDTLAAAVSADLSDMGLADRLPAEFFQLEPRPGIPWLLLVDGFDEIADPASRWQVQSTITWNSHDTRFSVPVAMRLRSPQSAKIGWNIRDSTVYWLQPFAPADLKDFAERWFTSIGLTWPCGHGTRLHKCPKTGAPDRASLHSDRGDYALPVVRGSTQ